MSVLVSVVIPTYNRAAFICKTIESVLNQTFGDLEIIVVDDGSTDNTKELLDPYIAKPNFRYYYQQNKGRSIARNEGTKFAKGEWIMYLDSDDYLKKDAIRKLYQLAVEAKDSDIVYANFVYVSNGQQRPGQEHLFLEKVMNRNLFFEMIDQRFCFTKTGTYLIRKKLDQEIGGFKTVFEPSEDYDYAIKTLLKAQVSYINDLVLYVERHSENTDEKEIERSFIKIWKHYLATELEWGHHFPAEKIRKVKNAFKLRIANSSYELNDHRQAFNYYTRLLRCRPSVIFDSFIFKQLFASMLPAKIKKMVK
ncbi:MAG: glycosyltransferase family 2 protein [Bacteroidota bacterium]|nr:glycosyltransferase family 2 protein [Bacteroidota bacterium]